MLQPKLGTELTFLLPQLECLLAIVFLSLTSSFFLLLRGQPKASCLLPCRLPSLECLKAELCTELALLLAKLEGLLLEAFLRLTGSLLLLLCRQAKTSRFLTSSLPGLVGLKIQLCAKLAFLLAEPERFLLELLLGLPCCFFLLLSRQADFCGSLPCLLSSLIRLKPKLCSELPLLLPKAEGFLLELLLRLARCFFLLLSGKPKLCSSLTGLLASLERLDLETSSTLCGLLRQAKGALAHLLCLLEELLASSTALQFLLSLLETCCPVCLKGSLSLLKGCLAATGLNVLQLLTEVALTLSLHDGFTIPAKTASLRCLLPNLGALDGRLPGCLTLLNIRNQLLVRVHVLL